jgi:hypothetical protein
MEPGEVIAGRYEIQQLCAAGGMAVVYRARDTASSAPVAVKVLRSNASSTELERFGREADILAALGHPAIVRSIDRGTTPLGESFIVQEWVDGVTLRERLRTAPLTLRESVAVGREIAVALGEAHAKGIVHRDVKPSNIMLVGGAPAAIKVLDFGIARMAHGPLRKLTRTGAVVGTINYMGPEQARGERDVDARADVFALGAVLYECVAGHEAFRGRTTLATRAKIIALEPAPMPADLPPALVELLHRFLAKAAADRPADGAAAAAALAALDELPDHAAPPYRAAAAEPSDQFTAVVMTAPAAALLGKTPDELRREVDDLSSAFGCAGAVMDDGAALITSPAGTPAARAAAVTRVALTLKRRWDVVPMAVAGGLDPAAADRSIDRCATSLDGAALSTVFADLDDSPVPGGVMVEPEVAALLQDDFEIETAGGGLRVLGERS